MRRGRQGSDVSNHQGSRHSHRSHLGTSFFRAVFWEGVGQQLGLGQEQGSLEAWVKISINSTHMGHVSAESV